MKKFIFGLILGAGLSFALSAQAEVKNYVGAIIQGQFPVTIDGVAFEAPGIVVDGTSYLPVRKFAESVGYDVKFNADMGIELTKKVLPGEVPTSPTTVEETTEVKISRIDGEISYLEGRLQFTKVNLNNAKTEEQKKNFETAIAEIEAKIAELEAEKAKLTNP